MNGLARSSVRFRPASFVGTFVALLFASVVVTACGILLQTGLTAHLAPVRYAHVPVVVAPHGAAKIHVGHGDDADTESEPLPETPRLSAALAGRIAARPGVAAAVPDVSFPVQGAGSHPLTGRNWAAAGAVDGARVVQGHAPGKGEVVLDQATARAAHTAVGRTLTLTAPGGTAAYRVAGLTAATPDPTAYVADSEAPRLSGHPGLADAIAVLPAKGVSTDRLADQARQAVGGAADVRTGDGRGAAEQPQLAEAKEMLTALGGSFGGIATATAVFVVMGTVALAIGQRAREFALLRAVGATPRQIRRTVATEALLVAPLAGAAGLLPGVALAHWWFDQLVHRDAVPHGAALDVGWIPMVVSVGAGLLAALTAGLLAARRPSKARPSAALGEAAVERRRPGVVRTVLGLVAMGGGVAVSIVASHITGDDAAATALGIVFCFMVGVALLGPVVAWLVSGLLGLPLRFAGAPGSLAAANTRANARRLASAITPIVLVTAFCGTLLFMQSSVQHATARQIRDGVVADQVLDSTGAGLPAGTAAKASATPGVAHAVGMLRGAALFRASGSLNSTTVLATDGDPAGLPGVLDLDVRDGSLAHLTGDGRTVAVDTLLADTAKAHVGDRIQLWLGDGTKVRPTVVAVYGRGLGLGSVLLPRAVVAPHAAAALDTQVLVRDAPGADPASVQRALGRLDVPGLHVTDRAGYRAQADHDLELNAWANRVMAGVLGGFAAVAAANTLVMTVVDRRREFALLRLAGATRRQVLRMLRAEAVVVAVSGLAIGAAIAWTTLVPIARGITGGAPYVPPVTALALTGATLLLALGATSIPARGALSGYRAAPCTPLPCAGP